MRILVVDDDLATHEVIANLLGHRGAVVKVAQSVAEAMEVLDSFKPTIVVSDIAMPGEDGYALIRQVRAHGVRVPALALSALASNEDRQNALDAGFQMHEAKPIRIDHLAGVLLDLAGQSDSFRERRSHSRH